MLEFPLRCRRVSCRSLCRLEINVHLMRLNFDIAPNILDNYWNFLERDMCAIY